MYKEEYSKNALRKFKKVLKEKLAIIRAEIDNYEEYVELLEAGKLDPEFAKSKSFEEKFEYILNEEENLTREIPKLKINYTLIRNHLDDEIIIETQLNRILEIYIDHIKKQIKEVQESTADEQIKTIENKFEALLKEARNENYIEYLLSVLSIEFQNHNRNLTNSELIDILSYEVFQTCKTKALEKQEEIDLKPKTPAPPTPPLKTQEVEVLTIEPHTREEPLVEESIQDTNEVVENPNNKLIKKINTLLNQNYKYLNEALYGQDNNYYLQIAEGIINNQEQFIELYNSLDDNERIAILLITLNYIKNILENNPNIDTSLYENIVKNIEEDLQKINVNKEIDSNTDEIQIYVLLDEEGNPIFDFDINAPSITDAQRKHIADIIKKLKSNELTYKKLKDNGKLIKSYYFDRIDDTRCLFKKINDHTYMIININTTNSGKKFFGDSIRMINNKRTNAIIETYEQSIKDGTMNNDDLEHQETYLSQLEAPLNKENVI